MLNRYADVYPNYRKFCWCAVFLSALALFTQTANCQRRIESEKPQSTVQFDTADQTNGRIAQLALASPRQVGGYRIGDGDLLSVEVFDVPELTRDVQVNEMGFVSLPLLPTKVQAAGLSLFQLQDVLEELLKSNGLITNPQVTVRLKELHSEPITVTGSVKTPTVIQAVRPMSLLQVISAAGGIAPDAGNEIVITRPASSFDGDSGNSPDTQSTTLKVSLNDLVYSGDLRFNVPVVGGDVVSVARAGVVYAVGALHTPGGFVMEGDRQKMTVLKIVSLSGGWLPSAKPNDAFILRTDPETGQRLHVPVDVKKILTLKSEDVALRQNDILYVPDSTAKRALRRSGEIAISLATGVALFRATAGVP